MHSSKDPKEKLEDNLTRHHVLEQHLKYLSKEQGQLEHVLDKNGSSCRSTAVIAQTGSSSERSVLDSRC